MKTRPRALLTTTVVLLCAAFVDYARCDGCSSSSFSVRDGEWSCYPPGNLTCLENAMIRGGRLYLAGDRDRNASLNLDKAGMGLYHCAVPILDITTLSINFTILNEQGGENDPTPGDGIAFVMFSNGRVPEVGALGGSFGVFNIKGFSFRQSFLDTLAVEFDTFYNPEVDPDPNTSNNHVGIDITSTASVAAAHVDFALVGTPVHAWIEYNASAPVLEVRVSDSALRPQRPLLRHTVNLREVFSTDEVYMGFSAANGAFFSYYSVIDFSVRSSSNPPPRPYLPDGEQKDGGISGADLFVGVGLGAGGLLVGVGLALCGAWRKLEVNGGSLCRRAEAASSVSGSSREFLVQHWPPKLKIFTYEELSAATNGFHHSLQLGRGGYGSVYHGFMLGSFSGVQIAVKKVNSEANEAERQFMAEVASVSMLRHRHIVHLLGLCNEGEGKYLLVYEFMKNGSLDQHIFHRERTGPSTKPILPWKLRLKILRQLAEAVQYLHEGWRKQVLHRDVKSSNVMLDHNFNAMLGDFGLARVSDHCKTPITTGFAGTLGYIAPEVCRTGKYSVKSDVFAFGAVCLELVCGRRAYSDGTLLVNYVWEMVSDDKVFSVVDQRLQSQFAESEVRLMLFLGLMCLHPRPADRPTMHKVVEILAGDVEMGSFPCSKPDPQEYWYSYEGRVKGSTFSGSEIEMLASSTSSMIDSRASRETVWSALTQTSHNSLPSHEISLEIR